MIDDGVNDPDSRSSRSGDRFAIFLGDTGRRRPGRGWNTCTVNARDRQGELLAASSEAKLALLAVILADADADADADSDAEADADAPGGVPRSLQRLASRSRGRRLDVATSRGELVERHHK